MPTYYLTRGEDHCHAEDHVTVWLSKPKLSCTEFDAWWHGGDFAGHLSDAEYRTHFEGKPPGACELLTVERDGIILFYRSDK